MGEKLTTEDFIKKSKEKHGDKYCYDKTIYSGTKKKVIITCKIHGDFEQRSYEHLNGNNCAECSGNKKLTTESFIKKAKLVHVNKYNYDKVLYTGSKTKIIITCKIHGDFEQEPRNHLSGFGCDKCGGTYNYNTLEFIEKAKLIHGDKYIYNKVNYINNENKIIITCKIHGDFEQTPYLHLNSGGCYKCGGKEKSNTRTFIEKSIKVHGNKYNYDKVDYELCKIKVTINCRMHGDFKQTPNSHLLGIGCPKCSSSKGEIIIKKLLEEKNISYKPQFTFPDLKYKKILYFDFGVLDSKGNLKYLLEYNGEQHYRRFVKFHPTEEKFKIAQYRDKLKMEYCMRNNIPLFIIKFDEDIKLEMEKIISLY